MIRRKIFITVLLAMSAAALPAAGQDQEPSEAAIERNGPVMENMRERAERVQERRKARVTHEQRKAVAERAKAAREKAAGKDSTSGTPEAGKGKGGVK